MSMSLDNNFVENAKRVKTERTKVIELITSIEKRTDPGTQRDSEMLLTLALNGYELIPLGTGFTPKAEYVTITSTGGSFDASFVVSADPKDL